MLIKSRGIVVPVKTEHSNERVRDAFQVLEILLDIKDDREAMFLQKM